MNKCLSLCALCLIVQLFLIFPVLADPIDNGEYTVLYRQGSDGLWRMGLSANHVFEIARLGSPHELEMGFACVHEAVNHFYGLLGRLYGFAPAPFPAPPGGC